MFRKFEAVLDISNSSKWRNFEVKANVSANVAPKVEYFI